MQFFFALSRRADGSRASIRPPGNTDSASDVSHPEEKRDVYPFTTQKKVLSLHPEFE